MPQPPDPGPHQSPIGPDSWWSEIESRSDVAPPRTPAAKSSAEAAARSAATDASAAPAAQPPPVVAAGSPSAHESPPFAPAISRPPVSYGVPQHNRKPYPVIILALLLVIGVGMAGAGLLSRQGHVSSSNTPA
ncbi:MAG TPA: hypothetical protein VIQ30_23810, partial [Pseudonocardia sp.]